RLTRGVRLRSFHLVLGFRGVLDPALRFGASRRIHQKCLQMIRGVAHIAATEEKKCQSVMRSRKSRLDRESATVAANCLVELSKLRVGDRHVLEDLVVVGPLAKGEAV